ncbi:P-loop containing nucleoside triphosphate hydrolase protein [Exidia glandulosa HHB12029]|uniref:p-loop containing nucleoside triphosphate hydrolase protein n=1 Tax=Exidia glandulosa HHB12029 TaxID=1314781 RepID=A0A165EYY8_EXIGL|nr:P-loop containing nucleoside triphosphate hydrolase protein [Exidia glandulosa HHB12029]
MPPKKGIVKSGNAGNSSADPKPQKTHKKGKGAPEPPPPAQPAAAPKPAQSSQQPLFPAFSKTPLSLLNERCVLTRAQDWDKPIVDTVSLISGCLHGFSFVVTLSRRNNKTSLTESVRMEPHPPYYMPTALEARHWGATYALHRVANHLQLDRVLPPGPREYWKQLDAERKLAPQHLSWMYEPDPWAAKRSVEDRQAKAAVRKEEVAAAPVLSPAERKAAREFEGAVEVRMAPAMRDIVERCIKDGAEGQDFTSDTKLVTDLEKLGFKTHHVRRTLETLSGSSPLAASLLREGSPLDAAIQHLVLSCPECDLPQRFLSANNSSVPFVASAHSGKEDLRVRWMEERAIKEAGFPAAAVKECSADPRVDGTFAHLISKLNSALLGVEWTFDPDTGDVETSSRDDEIDALQAVYPDAHYDASTLELQVPLPDLDTDLTLHVLFSAAHPYPAGDSLPAMYITSSDLPPYVRLHLLAQTLQADLGEPDEGRLFGAVEAVLAAYEIVRTQGPPEMSEVMTNLLPRAARKAKKISSNEASNGRTAGKAGTRSRSSPTDDRTNEQVRSAWASVVKSDKYMKLLETRRNLPSYAMKNEIVEAVEKNRVLVLVGSTGCGKTTQVPQFVLDALIDSGAGAGAQILVTQPRRVAAMSVAARVSAERAEDGSVGYAVRGESKVTKRTKILFCTTGVALRRLGPGGDGLEGLTHIIVDEVHERSVDGDFLLLELKDLLQRNDKLKIILMSATINQETFSKYFGNAPVLSIPGRTFPVQDVYIEEIIADIAYKPSFVRWNKQIEELKNAIERENSKLNDESVRTLAAISAATSVDPQLVAAVLGYVLKKTPTGAVLIFMSGVQEIRQTIEAIKSSTYGNQVDVLPLHANLTPEEQRLCFGRTNRQKIVVSTNVAEASLTIDDVVCVIDSGIAKEMRYDAEAGLSRLVETRISQSSGGQRRGRAGRTKPGTCYKLYSRRTEENMRKFVQPEILRVPLESLSLSVKAMREDEDVKSFLSRAIDPPSITAMDRAWVNLKALGAVGEDDELTALGKHMATMPLDLQLAKILVMGAIFSCVGPVLTIAACLSSKPLFLNPVDKRKEAGSARQKFLTANSDLLTLVAAYEAAADEVAAGGMRNARDFFEDNFISHTAFREIASLREDFWQCLVDIGFAPRHADPDDRAFNANSDNQNVVKAIIAAGLWPRICRVKTPRAQFQQTQGGTVEKENEAHELRFFDVRSDQRVFVHPGSSLFSATAFKSEFVAYFTKTLTSKLYIREVSEVPLYSILLFGGPISVNHVGGGLIIRTRVADDDQGVDIKLKAWPRIGVLVNFLRRLLEAHLAAAIFDPSVLATFSEQPVATTMVQLLDRDGMSA